jgi:hypothetical protein
MTSEAIVSPTGRSARRKSGRRYRGIRFAGAWRYKRQRFATSASPDKSVSVMMMCMRRVPRKRPSEKAALG